MNKKDCKKFVEENRFMECICYDKNKFGPYCLFNKDCKIFAKYFNFDTAFKDRHISNECSIKEIKDAVVINNDMKTNFILDNGVFYSN